MGSHANNIITMAFIIMKWVEIKYKNVNIILKPKFKL